MVNDSEESLTVSMISEKFDSFNDFRKVWRFLVRAGLPLLFTRCANSYRPCAAWKNVLDFSETCVHNEITFSAGHFQTIHFKRLCSCSPVRAEVSQMIFNRGSFMFCGGGAGFFWRICFWHRFWRLVPWQICGSGRFLTEWLGLERQRGWRFWRRSGCQETAVQLAIIVWF